MAEIYFCSKAFPGLKLQDPVAQIKSQRTAEFQLQPILESRVAFGRPVCYLILLVQL
jgi:hypothetical protein